MDGPGWSCSSAGACFSRDDVYELYHGLQPHTQTTPLQRLWQGQIQRSSKTRWPVMFWCLTSYAVIIDLTLKEEFRLFILFDLKCSPLNLLIYVSVCIHLCSLFIFFVSFVQVVCRACSRNRYPLKYLKDRVSKVCDHCYAELRKRGDFWLCVCRCGKNLGVFLTVCVSVGGSVSGACGNSSPRTHRTSRPLSAVFQSLQPPNLWKSRKSISLNQVD